MIPIQDLDPNSCSLALALSPLYVLYWDNFFPYTFKLPPVLDARADLTHLYLEETGTSGSSWKTVCTCFELPSVIALLPICITLYSLIFLLTNLWQIPSTKYLAPPVQSTAGNGSGSWNTLIKKNPQHFASFNEFLNINSDYSEC